ncbi:hypothetical protein BOSE62_50311 [Bosea sp. 62]|nr:hypothetical protein BOSE21B_100240 [Bosea sp. 21B]CAD5285024.1 hypothetical protein BOSE7B_41292 [Bosea sp. 7B]CAD5301605.1 hypothetical protein BOSE46_90607 [Bosea sp. 46]VVT57725.1 hypothetical protein BOS5A_200240 [Bosea sp. EC-HK365B]VXB30164.1 hypothetical protein BOSE29B_100049 [Bosea sp. 29B]VXB73711.1 hypothetical protein BOSE125_150048 [Bosea sp. 125]VXC63822.1 hypothetical protein BOSE62_50311 [Bosea sp. 62]VXC92436.1 hypothetical protein BOSE127_80075 [Bosea sp. 127]
MISDTSAKKSYHRFYTLFSVSTLIFNRLDFSKIARFHFKRSLQPKSMVVPGTGKGTTCFRVFGDFAAWPLLPSLPSPA